MMSAQRNPSLPPGPDVLAETIDPSLCPDDRVELVKLLKSYSHLFDVGKSNLGMGKGVSHRIDTGDSWPHPYHVSASVSCICI